MPTLPENLFTDLEVDPRALISDLEIKGYSVVPGVLKPEACAWFDARARSLMDANAGYDKRAGALNEVPEMAPLCLYPPVLAVVKHFFGEPFYLANNVNMFWAQPGAPGGDQHTDWPSWNMPEPYPPWPMYIQSMWFFTAFTADNGATRVVPESHRWGRMPPPHGEYFGEVPAEGPAGSLFIWNGNVWHRNVPNITADSHRMGVGPGYIPHWLHRPEDGWPLIKREIYEILPEKLKPLLARSVEAA